MKWRFWEKEKPPTLEPVEEASPPSTVTMSFKDIKETVLVTYVNEETGEEAIYFIDMSKDELAKLSSKAVSTLISSITLSRFYTPRGSNLPSGLIGYSGGFQASTGK